MIQPHAVDSTKAERRERKRRPKMKVSGAHVRKIQRMLAARARPPSASRQPRSSALKKD